MQRPPRTRYQNPMLELTATILDNFSLNLSADLKKIGSVFADQMKNVLSCATIISAIAAAFAAVQSSRQVKIAYSERLTPYKISIFQTKSENYVSLVRAASKLEESFRKALLINPIFLEDERSIKGRLTPNDLLIMNSSVGFIVDDFYEFERATKAIDVIWSLDAQNSAIDVRNSAHTAMGCFFVIGPTGRNYIVYKYFESARTEIEKRCPETRRDVIAFLEQVEITKQNLKSEIERIGVPIV